MVSGRARPALAAALAAALALPAAGCEFGEIVIASPAPTLVVHAVLDPDQPVQQVLVEETLTGRVTIDTTVRFDPTDPIATGGGLPVGGASVVIVREATGDSLVADEGRIGDGAASRATGVYRVASAAGATRRFVPGEAYRLRIRLRDGRVVDGRTRIPGPLPSGTPSTGEARTDTLDRARDTLRVAWRRLDAARTYAVRVETPNGPFFLFNDSTSFAFAGGLRNLFQPGLPSVWQPGHVQRVVVAAVDTSFFDYYRSGNDPFGGSGLISRLTGAIGLFGALVTVDARRVSVFQSPRAPLDARWAGVGDSLDLWLETPGTTFSSVSGRLRRPGTGGPAAIPGTGTLRGDALAFALREDGFEADTAAVFSGRVFADSIVGAFAARLPGAPAGPRTYRRAGPPRPP